MLWARASSGDAAGRPDAHGFGPWSQTGVLLALLSSVEFRNCFPGRAALITQSSL